MSEDGRNQGFKSQEQELNMSTFSKHKRSVPRSPGRVKIASRGSVLGVSDIEQTAHKDQISRNGSNFKSPQMREFITNDKDEVKSILSPGKFQINSDLDPRNTFMNRTLNNMGSIRKLPICGEKDHTKQGYSLFEWHSKTH